MPEIEEAVWTRRSVDAELVLDLSQNGKGLYCRHCGEECFLPYHDVYLNAPLLVAFAEQHAKCARKAVPA